MNLSEFETLVRQGRGAAVLKLRAEIDKTPFRKAVIDAALNDYRYDRQCSDDQSYYVNQLIYAFDCPEKLITEIESHRHEALGDNYTHYVETLGSFCAGGRKESGAILAEFYRERLAVLLTRTAEPEAYDTQRDDFCRTFSVAVGAGVVTPEAVLSDIGRLLCKDGLFRMWDFSDEIDMLLADGVLSEETLNRSVRVADAYHTEKARTEALRTKKERRFFEDVGTLITYIKSGKPLDFGMKRYMRAVKPEELLAVSELAYKETDIKRKIVLYHILPAFISPRSSMLVDEMKKYEYALKNPDCPEYLLALQILHHFGNTFSSDTCLRGYAEEFLGKDYPEYIKLELRAQIYDKSQHDGFVAYIKSIPIVRSEDDLWHTAHFCTVTLCDCQDDAPFELLPFIFENTRCASCREHAFRIMKDRSLLTDSIIAEGKYDSEKRIRYVCCDHYYDTIIADMRKNGVIFANGLTKEEMDKIERFYNIRFPNSLRLFYSKALPVSDGFPRWNDFSEENVTIICGQLDFPRTSLMSDVENGGYWCSRWGERPADALEARKKFDVAFAKAPCLIPVCSNRYLTDVNDSPVFSVQGKDTFYYGNTLTDYLVNEFIPAHKNLHSPIYYQLQIPFWSDLVG